MIILAAILAATALMIGVYALPTEPMKQNTARSSAIFDYEGVYPQVIHGYKSSQLDNCTDATMLGIAVYSENAESPVIRAMKNERVEYIESNPVQSLNDYSNNVAGLEEQFAIAPYTRYWHGYLVFLKPLLLLFDYSDIRCINMICQMFLCCWLIGLMFEKGYKRLIIPLSVLILILNPCATALSLQFSSVYYIVLISLLLLIKYDVIINGVESSVYFFLIIGILTSFLDFLTYPTITLGIPLVMILVLKKNWEVFFKVKEVLKLSFAWGIGYVLMWSGKWVMASIILDSNAISAAVSQVLLRASSEDGGVFISRVGTFWRNLRVLIKWPYVLIAIMIVCYIAYAIIRHGSKIKGRKIISEFLPYLLIILIPIAWLMFTANHAWACYWFTFRNLGTVGFAVCAFLIQLPKRIRMK